MQYDISSTSLRTNAARCSVSQARKMRGYVSILAIVLSGFQVQSAYADSVFWNGSANGDWFTDSNWVWDGHTPRASDSARIDSAGPLITSGQTGSVGTLFVGLGNTANLTLAGTLNSGTVTLGNSVGSNGAVTVSGGTWTNTGNLYIGNAGVGTVSLTSGATASSDATYLGASPGGTGTLTLAGQSSFTSSGTLYVGYGGTPSGTGGAGTVTVSSGTLSSATASLADGARTTGAVTITGAQSIWNNTGGLVIGNAGIASLTVSTGGQVTTGDAAVANLALADTSSLLITDANSKLTSTGSLIVGGAGGATLTVQNGGALVTGGAAIGRHSTSSATITGSGSSWTTGALQIGGDTADPTGTAGNGTLTINSSASVNSASVRVGAVSGATGTTTVDNATWTIGSGRIFVGDAGTGALTISNGATVSGTGGIIGNATGVSGSATVSDSSWTNTGNLYVGNNGNGTLTINAGGNVTALDGYVATLTGSNSAVTVTGANAKWALSGVFIAGYQSGTTANITLSDGGRISGLQGTLGDLAGSSGTMTVTGSGSLWSAAVDSAVTYSGYMNVGLSGNGALIISNGGGVSAYQFYIGNNSSSTGTVDISGTGSSMTITNNLLVGADGTGTMTLSDGAAVSANAIKIAYSAGSTGTLNIGSAAGQAARAAGTISANQIIFGLGAGKLVLNHTNTSYTLASAISGGGQVLARNGVTTLSGTNTYSGGTTISGGTLIGTATSFGSGAIVDNSALVVSGSGTFANTMSGTGSFEKTGAGTLTLSGANSYTGGTTISGGTLVVTTSNLTGSIVDNATLAFNQSFDGTFAGNISGSGNVIKDGTGTVTLTGTLAYSGTTTILAGQLIGNTTTIAGPVVNAGQITFSQNYDGTYTASISGSGSVLKSGSGTMILTNSSSYTGGTTISGGTLVGMATSFGSGGIVDNAALVVTGSGTLANTVSGTGTFEKTGSGKLILTGTNTYSGGTTVSGGILSVNGSIVSSVTVASGGTLGGYGSVGSVLVASNGTFAPGNSIGTVTTGGNVTFASGSTYDAEVNASGNSDKIIANGTVTIAGNTTLSVSPENKTDDGSTYAANTRYTIITATGGVQGTFSNVVDTFRYLTAAASYDSNAVYLTLTRSLGFADGLATSNSRAAARAVETLAATNPLYNAALYLQTGEAQTTFSQLAAEIHPSAAAALLERSRLSREKILDRLRGTADTRSVDSTADQAGGQTDAGVVPMPLSALGIWMSAFGSGDHFNGNGNAAALDAGGGGVLIGADAPFDDVWRLGVAAGYGHDTLKQGSMAASANVDSAYLSIYGKGTWGPASLRLGSIQAFQTIDTKRSVTASTLSNSLSSKYGAMTTQVFAEGAWRFDFDLTHAEPYANLAYVHLNTDGFNESGGAAGVSSSAKGYDRLYSVLGARFTRDIILPDARGNVSLGLGWQHAYGPSTATTAVSFSASNPFSISSTSTGKDTLFVDVGFGFDVTKQTRVSVGYKGGFGGGTNEQSASANLAIRF